MEVSAPVRTLRALSDPVSVRRSGPGGSYSKNESLSRAADFEGFDALLTESPRVHEGERFRTVHTAHVFAGFDWRAARVRSRPAVHVMLRRRSTAEWAVRCEGAEAVEEAPSSHAAQE